MAWVMVLAIVVFSLAFAGIALGVILGRQGPSGSCGGKKPVGPDGQPLTCDHCTCAGNDPASSSAPRSAR